VNVKQAIAEATETVSLEPVKKGIMMRFVRNEVADAVARGDIDPKGQPYAGPVLEMFDSGDLSLAMVGAGESAALLSEIKPAAEIIDETVTGFWQEIERLTALLGPCAMG
jgi:NAD(P)H-dependent flavin oxidoreductase YrpB (nitropropane dioxygenase family)